MAGSLENPELALAEKSQHKLNEYYAASLSLYMVARLELNFHGMVETVKLTIMVARHSAE